eukprot:15182194-Alexandrium_andersonii.AAC.1
MPSTQFWRALQTEAGARANTLNPPGQIQTNKAAHGGLSAIARKSALRSARGAGGPATGLEA